ncbi:MAG: hypothetical protein AB1442_10735 [Nitrospirota bacterium]
MSKKEKLLENITDAPSNVVIADLVRLMKYHGFTNRKSKEGYFFKHEKLRNIILPNVPIPHGRENKVRKLYVLQCLRAIEQLKSLESE